MAKQKGYFYLDRVKSYLDGVLSEEEHLNTYEKVAADIYRVYSHKVRICLQDVDAYLRGLPLGVAYTYDKTEPYAEEWTKNISSLTSGRRSKDDVYWWALSECIWTFGAIRSENPKYNY